MVWPKESRRHSMASKGIKTKEPLLTKREAKEFSEDMTKVGCVVCTARGHASKTKKYKSKIYKYHASYYSKDWADFRQQELEDRGWDVKRELTKDGIIRLYKRVPGGLR